MSRATFERRAPVRLIDDTASAIPAGSILTREQTQNIIERAIVTLRPEVFVAPRINQLSSDANTIAGRLHASFDNVRHAKLIRDFAQVTFYPSLVLHH